VPGVEPPVDLREEYEALSVVGVVDDLLVGRGEGEQGTKTLIEF